MTEEEAVEILEEICGCTDPFCADTQYRSLRLEAKAVLEDIYAEDIAEAQIHEWEMEQLYAEPPANWEP